MTANDDGDEDGDDDDDDYDDGDGDGTQIWTTKRDYLSLLVVPSEC